MTGYEHCFADGERVRLVVSYSSTGRRYEQGWTGSICPLTTSLRHCQESDNYEVNLDDGPAGEDRGMIRVPSTYFERASSTRQSTELRQGDRVRLLTEIQGALELYEAGTVVTVICTRTKVDGASHDVIVDFADTLTVPRESLETEPGGRASVEWSTEEGAQVSFLDSSPI